MQQPQRFAGQPGHTARFPQPGYTVTLMADFTYLRNLCVAYAVPFVQLCRLLRLKITSTILINQIRRLWACNETLIPEIEFSSDSHVLKSTYRFWYRFLTV